MSNLNQAKTQPRPKSSWTGDKLTARKSLCSTFSQMLPEAMRLESTRRQRVGAEVLQGAELRLQDARDHPLPEEGEDLLLEGRRQKERLTKGAGGLAAHPPPTNYEIWKMIVSFFLRYFVCD